NHHAVAALEAPHTAAGPDVDVVNLAGREVFRAFDIVDVVGISTVDENVPWFEMGQEIGNGLVDNCRWNHQPECSRRLEFIHEISQRICSYRLVLDQVRHRFGGPVKHNAAMSVPDQPADHVGAHAAKSDHS